MLQQVARLPLGGTTLVSPYDKDTNSDAVIHAAEDFTVSITTISEQLYTKYKQHYKAGEFDNDFFVLLSQTGLGNVNQPTTKLHFVERIERIDRDILDLWAENVRTVTDYRDKKEEQGEGGEAGRLYLSFHSFCQDLDGSRLDDISRVGNELIRLTGAIFPNLVPFTSMANVALSGVNNLLKKLLRNRSECKTAGLNLYPVTGSTPSPGDAPLQTGSYVFFFEETDITNLQLDTDGVVRASSGQSVNPYIVVNIKKGIILAPDQLDISVAREILDKFQEDYGYPLPRDQQKNNYIDGLKQLGESYRFTKFVDRYYQLQNRGTNRTSQETAKMEALKQELQNKFPNLPL